MAKAHIAFTIGTFDGISEKEAELFRQMRKRSKNEPVIFVSPDEKAFERTGKIPAADIDRRKDICRIFTREVYSQNDLALVLQKYIDAGQRLVFYGIKEDEEYARIVDRIAPILKKLHLPRRMLKIMV